MHKAGQPPPPGTPQPHRARPLRAVCGCHSGQESALAACGLCASEPAAAGCNGLCCVPSNNPLSTPPHAAGALVKQPNARACGFIRHAGARRSQGGSLGRARGSHRPRPGGWCVFGLVVASARRCTLLTQHQSPSTPASRIVPLHRILTSTKPGCATLKSWLGWRPVSTSRSVGKSSNLVSTASPPKKNSLLPAAAHPSPNPADSVPAPEPDQEGAPAGHAGQP